MADATRDYVEGAFESYRMRRDERSEVGIRRLVVLAGIIGPLTLLAGCWGSELREHPRRELVLGVRCLYRGADSVRRRGVAHEAARPALKAPFEPQWRAVEAADPAPLRTVRKGTYPGRRSGAAGGWYATGQSVYGPLYSPPCWRYS